MPSPVALILGAGARVGQSSAQAFKAAGYSVALASRSLDNGITNSDGFFQIRADFAEPTSIPSVFEAVEKALGTSPSVVIYNAASAQFFPRDDPLSSLDVDLTIRDLAVNATSAIIAAKYAVAGFARLPSSASRTFVFTGNLLNILPRPGMFTIGAGKTAMAHTIEAMTKAYADKGYKFYYADERYEDGASPLNKIDGPAHAKEYLELAEDPKQRDWEYTFVKGVGYKRFTVADAENTKW